MKYHFTISSKRKIKKITLDFHTEDFRHASGLHYIDDISIENNQSKIIDAIIDQKITDEILNKSSKYKAAKTAAGSSIKERIEEMRYLENYLDSSEFIFVHFYLQSSKLLKSPAFNHKRNRIMVSS